MKVVQDLGEEELPEPQTLTASSDPLVDGRAQGEVRVDETKPAEQVESKSSLVAQEGPTAEATTFSSEDSSESSPLASSSSPSSPASAATPEPALPLAEEPKNPTTIERPPMKIPDTIHVRITPKNLKDYVGPPVYQNDRMYARPPPPGVSTGLGYLGNGSGAVMPIEAMSMPGKGALQLTGKLGEVIRESAQIGLSWVKAHAYELGITDAPDGQFLTDKDVHVHMPEGSVGKEGPSAGTAILTAFVSLFTKTKVSSDIGEFRCSHIFGGSDKLSVV